MKRIIATAALTVALLATTGTAHAQLIRFHSPPGLPDICFWGAPFSSGGIGPFIC